MATSPQAHSSSTILEAIRLHLVSESGLDDTYVRTVANDDYQYTFEQQMIAIRPLTPQPYPAAGAGRRARPVSRTIRVYLNQRSSLDNVGDDRLLVGLLCNFEDQIYNALDEFIPFSSDQVPVPLTIEPLHPTDSSNDPPTRKPIDDVGMCFSRLDFEIRYLLVNQQ